MQAHPASFNATFRKSSVALLVAAAGLLALAAAVPASAATGQDSAQSSEVARSTVKIKPHGLRGGRSRIMSKVTIGGNIKPYSPGQRVRVKFFHNAKQFTVRRVKVKKGPGGFGTFRASVYTKQGGKYAAQAKYYGQSGKDPISKDATVRKSWKVSFRALRPGQCGRVVRGFRKALNRLRMVPSNNTCFDGKMERAVLAYRKLNSLGRSPRASKSVVERIFNGVGGYRVLRPELGDHMETSLSKQVLVFARGNKPYAIFPIASGAPATPTILGTFSVYWKDPGYNEKGMYNSSYFIRGYAIHGYQSVPNYPASHGCLRTFIADQPRIYDMTFVGQPIYVYGNARSLTPFKYRGLDPGRFDPAT